MRSLPRHAVLNRPLCWQSAGVPESAGRNLQQIQEGHQIFSRTQNEQLFHEIPLELRPKKPEPPLMNPPSELGQYHAENPHPTSAFAGSRYAEPGKADRYATTE